jgi:hypothetical protein
MYYCPNNSCGFGDKPDRCKHGEWLREGTTAPSAGPMRFKISREAAAKLLGLATHRVTPLAENLWVRNVAPREAVKARYRADAASEALEKQRRERFVRPGGLSMMRDPQRPNILIPVSEFVAREL